MYVTWLGFALSQAVASDVGHYHPDVVAQRSVTFGRAAAAAGPSFENAQNQLRIVGEEIAELEQGVLLLGADAPHETQIWSEGVRKEVTGRFLQIQRHVDLLQDDYSRVFGEALDRALASVGSSKDVRECKSSGGIQSIMRRGGVNTCDGEDLNAPLVAAIDADKRLIADIDEINGVPWPQLTVDGKPQPVAALTGKTRWVSSGAVVPVYASGSVKRRQDVLDRELAPLADLMSQGDSSAIERGRQLRFAYENEMALDGDILWTAAQLALEKAEKKGGALTEVGVCANPVSMGGCVGEDVTAQVLEILAADRKFLKTVAALGD